MQSLKKKGKYAVEAWNEGSYADYPKIYLNTYLGFITSPNGISRRSWY